MMMHFRPAPLAVALACSLLACGEPDTDDVSDPIVQDASTPSVIDAAAPEQGAASADAGNAAEASTPVDAGVTVATRDAQSTTDGKVERDAAGATLDATPDAAPAKPDAALDANANDAASDASEDAGPRGMEAGSPPGNGGVVNETIVVAAGKTFDGQGKRYRAGSALGDGSQSEGQKPMFKLEDGATLRNVVLGSPAADGIHTYGDVTLENIVWEDIGEDALTIKESGTVVLNGGSARNGDDKVFQINAASTFRVSNFTASQAGKFIRQNGGTTFRVDVYIDRCDISNMKESIFRTDSKVSTVSMKNTRYSQIGKELFYGVNPANITTANNTQY